LIANRRGFPFPIPHSTHCNTERHHGSVAFQALYLCHIRDRELLDCFDESETSYDHSLSCTVRDPLKGLESVMEMRSGGVLYRRQVRCLQWSD